MKKGKVVVSLLLFWLLASCTHYYYTPNSQNVPLLQEKGESRISASYYGSEESTGFVLNSALSITDNIGLIGNFIKGGAEESTHWGRGNFSELGIGYFIPTGNNIIFECYGGFGLGNVKNHYSNDFESKMNFSRYYIQPSLGYTSNVFEFAMSNRFCLLNYYNIQYDSELKEFHQITDIRYISNHENFILIEPAFTLRVGSEKFKIQAQLVRSIPYKNQLKMEEVNFNIGFIIKI